MDKLAATLDIDPVELRLPETRLQPGDVLPTGQTLNRRVPRLGG